MSKLVLFKEDSQPKLLKGFNIVAEAVGGTLGPRGRNVYIDMPMTPEITNDGATIAQNIELPDKVENMGANIIRNASSQTNDDAGDGTTTTAVLLQSIVQEAIKRPENPMDIMNSLNDAYPKIEKELKKKSVKITKNDIRRVALISAENEIIADSITKIVDKLGTNAAITVEDSRTGEIETEMVDGYEAHVGFLSPEFANEKGRARCVMNDVDVLCVGRKISAVSDIASVQNICKEKGISSLVIVCEDIEDAILGIYTLNKKMGLFNALVIRATGDLLKDIEASVGARRISNETGVTFQNVNDKCFGKVKKIVCDANKTLFIPKNPNLSLAYAQHLEEFAREEKNTFVHERLMKRISQLKGSIAVLKIGAATDFARVYLKRKAEDAVKAVKAASEEGITEGGGMTLWRIAQAMKPKTIGEEILKKSLVAPLKRIVQNCGLEYAEIIKNLPEGMGYDAKNDEYVDMIKNGIIDPVKVTRCALENALSAGSNFITSFCTICDYTEPKEK